MTLPNSDALVGLLPHRPPFRFVQSVDELVVGQRCVARYQVSGDEEFLVGHFPGNPVFPGVIQLEALAQTGAIAVLADERFTGRLPLFGGVDEVRFRRMVVPGDALILDVTMERLSSKGGWAVAQSSVNGAVTCKARLFFALAPKAPTS